MAKIISDDLELEFKFLGCYDYQPVEFEFKVTLQWKGVPILKSSQIKFDCFFFLTDTSVKR